MAQICSMESANRFLDEYFLPFWERRFTVQPADPVDAHRPLPKGSIFSVCLQMKSAERSAPTSPFATTTASTRSTSPMPMPPCPRPRSPSNAGSTVQHTFAGVNAT